MQLEMVQVSAEYSHSMDKKESNVGPCRGQSASFIQGSIHISTSSDKLFAVMIWNDFGYEKWKSLDCVGVNRVMAPFLLQVW